MRCDNCTERCPQAEMANDIAKGRMFAEREFINLINKIENGTLVEVVHGEWIPFEGETGVEAFGYKEYTTLGFNCSVCHTDIDVSEQYFRYCPMCGSKMDRKSISGEKKG